MKKIITLLLLITLSISCNKDTTTKIYFVRHAEKVLTDPNNNNPALTEEGIQRSINLSKELKKNPLDAIYSTDYIRTKATVNPIAKDKNLTIQLYDANKLNTEALTILNKNRGKTVLIVGHSNTLLEMIEFMNAKRPIAKIEDNDYNNLFLLTIHSDATTSVEVMQFTNSK
jgi:broad specificity phosphatase PhoE